MNILSEKIKEKTNKNDKNQDAFDSLAELIRSSPFSRYDTKKTKWMEQPSNPIDRVPS